MSHLTSDGEHLHPTEKQPFNSVVPPDPDTASDGGNPKFAERAANFVKSKIPDQLEQYPDTDPAREKALADSVRAGVVDDLPLEEQRQVYDPHRKQV